MKKNFKQWWTTKRTITSHLKSLKIEEKNQFFWSAKKRFITISTDIQKEFYLYIAWASPLKISILTCFDFCNSFSIICICCCKPLISSECCSCSFFLLPSISDNVFWTLNLNQSISNKIQQWGKKIFLKVFFFTLLLSFVIFSKEYLVLHMSVLYEMVNTKEKKYDTQQINRNNKYGSNI